jgi:hypothetical protein
MPGGDRTGPMGMGPVTGRAAGYCAGYGVPGYMNPVAGRGLGLGWGRGWRHWTYATGLPGWARFGYAPAWGAPPVYGPSLLTGEQQAEALKTQAEWLNEQLEALNQRIAELEGEE